MYPAWWGTEAPMQWGLGGLPQFGGANVAANGGNPMRISVEELFAVAKQAERASATKAATEMVLGDFVGEWMDSLGNAVSVTSIDAYEMKMVACLSRPPRADIHLSLRPIACGPSGGGWQCGNSVLDCNTSSSEQLYWLTGDGRISVWVKLRGPAKAAPKQSSGGKSPGPTLRPGSDSKENIENAKSQDTKEDTEGASAKEPADSATPGAAPPASGPSPGADASAEKAADEPGESAGAAAGSGQQQ